MLDAKDVANTLRQIATEAIQTSNPSDFVFGTVVSETPLKIQIDQKITLVPEQLVLCRDVTEYETKVTIGVSDVDEGTLIGETKTACGNCGSGCSSPPHKHILKSVKHIKTKIIVHNQLKVGEKVALLKEQGGQRYLVVDRIGEM